MAASQSTRRTHTGWPMTNHVFVGIFCHETTSGIVTRRAKKFSAVSYRDAKRQALTYEAQWNNKARRATRLTFLYFDPNAILQTIIHPALSAATPTRPRKK